MNKLPYHGESVKLVWKYGEEAICPKCGNGNACLSTMFLGKTSIYECRDCHIVYICSMLDENARVLGNDPTLGRPILERDARIITRSLGKRCYVCNSFELREVSFEYRQDFEVRFVADGKGDKWQAAMARPTHICSNCGKEHRY